MNKIKINKNLLNLILYQKEDEIDTEFKSLFFKENFKSVFVIFLITVLLLPFSFCLIITYGFNFSPDTITQINSFFIIASSAVGFFCTYYLRPKYKDWIFVYLFSLLPIVVILLFSIITSIFKVSSDSFISKILSVWSQIVTEIIIIFVYLFKFKNINKICKTILKKYFKIVLISLVFIGLIYLLSFFISSKLIEEKLFKLDTSKNQEELNSIIKPNDKSLRVFGIITLFVSAVIIAPLCEEICTRHSVFFIANNRWIGLFLSAIYFGFIHYGAVGDFGHVTSYTMAGFILSYLFNYVNGNITYSWIVHTFWNLISFSILIVGN